MRVASPIPKPRQETCWRRPQPLFLRGVTVQARKYSRKVHPKQRDHARQKSGCEEHNVYSSKPRTKKVSEVEIPEEHQPRHQGPQFLGVPVTIVAPGQFTLCATIPWRAKRFSRFFAPPPAAGLPRGIADRFDLVS